MASSAQIKAPKLIAQAKSARKIGDIDTARDLYQQVLDRFPGNRRAREGLAQLALSDPRVSDLLNLWTAGQVQAALDLSLDLSVAHPTVRDIRAAALRKLGRPKDAVALYSRALAQDKGNAKLWYNCGAASLEAHELSRAAECLMTAVSIDPDPAHVLALAQCRLDQGYFWDVTALCDDVLGRDDVPLGDQARAHNLRGSALLGSGDADKAQASFESAHAIAAKDVSVLHNLGIAANALGDSNAARTWFRAAVSGHPKQTAVHHSLARLTQYTPDHPHLAQMRAMLMDDMSPEAAADLHFALFKASDDIGDIDNAMQHLQRGNALRRAALGYDAGRDNALFQYLAALEPPECAVTDPSAGPRPVFVVGLPRSGTTLTEQVLSGAPGTVPAGELPYVGHAAAKLLKSAATGAALTKDLAVFADDIRAQFARHANAGDVLIDKMPLNFRWSELILAALPEAKIIWLDRDPIANAFSLYRHSFAGSGNRFAYDPTDIAAMISHERAHRARVTARFPDRIHVLSLHALTTRPGPTIRDLVAFCDLPWSDACLAPETRARAVLTASAQQVRTPIQPRAASIADIPDQYLAPLRAALTAQGFLG